MCNIRGAMTYALDSVKGNYCKGFLVTRASATIVCGDILDRGDGNGENLKLVEGDLWPTNVQPTPVLGKAKLQIKLWQMMMMATIICGDILDRGDGNGENLKLVEGDLWPTNVQPTPVLGKAKLQIKLWQMMMMHEAWAAIVVDELFFGLDLLSATHS
ncbi:UNVERIFIED_CONTAM: hypothetical protein FKN15_058382 [Acipenser sinensis]